MIWDTQSLASALEVQIQGDIQANAVKFNSLEIEENDIFIALPGNRDGHDFVGDALQRGAACAIVSQDNIPDIDTSKLIKVENTIAALNKLAEHKRQNVKAKFIAITGSVGKTTTREIVKLMLSAHGKSYASCKSFNNHLGVPLTLASMPNDTEYAIIELGMNTPGELAALSKIVRPDIALITTVAEAHIEFFDSVEAIADAKCEIFTGLEPNSGIAIINRDMSTYEHCFTNITNFNIKHLYSFGSRLDANIRFTSYELLENNNVRLGFNIDLSEYEIIMNTIPEHLASNFAAGFAIIQALDLDIEASAQVARRFEPLMGRGRFVETEYQGNKIGVICDYYNANPKSMRAALKYLKQFPNKGKIAILGNMGELGKKQDELHASLVPAIAESGAEILILVGDIIEKIVQYVPENIQVKCYERVDDVRIDDIIDADIPEQIMLIKGSRSLKLEKIASNLGIKNVL